MRLLADIHSHGFLDGDIQHDNKVKFSDFAFSKKVCNQEEPKREMAGLKMPRPNKSRLLFFRFCFFFCLIMCVLVPRPTSFFYARGFEKKRWAWVRE